LFSNTPLIFLPELQNCVGRRVKIKIDIFISAWL
jgi:hypothetical protein